ncbi:MAG: hypothetical protein ACP5QI_07495 [Candidatus Bathyarchaeia archaeon]
MYRLVYPAIVPVMYQFKVREGARRIVVTCSWEGVGSVNFRMISPERSFSEKDFQVKERTDIHVKDGVSSYHGFKEVALEIKPPVKGENWTLELEVSNIVEYRLSIEVS